MTKEKGIFEKVATKSKDELMKMDIKEIANYVDELERFREFAKRNSVEYQNWCTDVLDKVLIGKGCSNEYFQELLTNAKAINNLRELDIKKKEAEEEVDCLIEKEVKKIASNINTAKDYAHDIAMVRSMEDDEYYKELFESKE